MNPPVLFSFMESFFRTAGRMSKPARGCIRSAETGSGTGWHAKFGAWYRVTRRSRANAKPRNSPRCMWVPREHVGPNLKAPPNRIFANVFVRGAPVPSDRNGKAEHHTPGYQSEDRIPTTLAHPAGFAIPEVPERPPTPGENPARKLERACSPEGVYSGRFPVRWTSRTAQTRDRFCRRPPRLFRDLIPGAPTPLQSDRESRRRARAATLLGGRCLATSGTLARMVPRDDRGAGDDAGVAGKRASTAKLLGKFPAVVHIDNVRWGRLPVRPHSRPFLSTSTLLGGSNPSGGRSANRSGPCSTLPFQSSTGNKPRNLADEIARREQSAFGWMPAWNGPVDAGNEFFRPPRPPGRGAEMTHPSRTWFWGCCRESPRPAPG